MTLTAILVVFASGLLDIQWNFRVNSFVSETGVF